MKPVIICFLVLISILGCATAARILDDVVDPQPPVDTTLPDGLPQAPIVPPETPGNPSDVLPPVVPPVVTTPAPLDTTVAPDAAPLPADAPAPLDTAASAVGPATPLPAGPDQPALTFFMHDVLGGSQASGRVVTGIVATSGSSNIPFSKPNNQAFPVSGGVPLFNNQINGIVNNNNAPVLAAMNSQQLQQQSSTVIQNAGTGSSVVNGGSGNSQAFVTAGQLPQGASLQELMFGSITVIDDEMTEGHELGSTVLGSAQGFYLASSLDGQSHTMAWTSCFHGDSTISFFGVHRPAAPLSYVAVIGGTGKYENAKGYATIEALPQVDQFTTDGVETIVHISVYFS